MLNFYKDVCYTLKHIYTHTPLLKSNKHPFDTKMPVGLIEANFYLLAPTVRTIAMQRIFSISFATGNIILILRLKELVAPEANK